VTMTLWQRLVQAVLSETSMAAVCEFTSVIYPSTTNSHTGDLTTRRHMLRKMVIEFVAVYCGKLLTSQAFRDLISTGSELLVDMLMTMQPQQ